MRKSEIFLRASVRETLLQRVRTSHLRVVSSAAGKTQTVETREHADAARRAHSILSCVSRRISAGLLTLERNDRDVRASAGYFSETCNYSDERKKTCLWTYAGKRKMPTDLESSGKYEEMWQISAWIARVFIIQHWYIIESKYKLITI